MKKLSGQIEQKKNNMYKTITSCLCCKNKNLFTVLDLGHQPPANSFHYEHEILDNYELKLLGCDVCWHTQLSIAVDPNTLFKNYLYVSGTSNTLKDYFDWFAKSYDFLGSEKTILDIACNDGSQLDSFKKLGWKTYGVDPAENLYETSLSKGHNVFCSFWGKHLTEQLPKFDLIVAQNVFAHTANVEEFLASCKEVMHSETKLLIQTSQANMFDNNEFDTIYHEHISFFSASSMKVLCQKNNLYLNKISKTDIHGTSYIFEIGLLNQEHESVSQTIKEESHRYSVEFFNSYKNNALKCLDDLKYFVEEHRAKNKKVVGYGAAAKGMTVLNAGKINLDYIVDDNPLKQGRLTPGRNTLVVSSQILKDEVDDLIIIPLAWNFYKEICDNVKRIRPNNKDLFVRYFPRLDTVSV